MAWRAGRACPTRFRRGCARDGINATIVNAGVSGDTTAAGRQRLAFALDNLPRKPDLVMLGLGGNDVLRQIAPAETRANMTAMLDELEKRGIPVVLTGMMAPPNLGPDFASAFNAIWPDLAQTLRCGALPVHPRWRDRQPDADAGRSRPPDRAGDRRDRHPRSPRSSNGGCRRSAPRTDAWRAANAI